MREWEIKPGFGAFSSEYTVKVIRLAGNELQLVPPGDQGPAARRIRRSVAISRQTCAIFGVMLSVGGCGWDLSACTLTPGNI